MGFRFQKRIRLLEGLTFNLSKTGASWTLGKKGASINVRGGKITGNAGIPGTGLSYRERLDNKSGGGFARVLFIMIAVAAIGYVLTQRPDIIQALLKN